MSITHPPPVTPWYESRYSSFSTDKNQYAHLSVREIHEALNASVIGQTEATKQVAMQMYLTLHHHRSIYAYAGHTASGKTYMFEQLSKLFPGYCYVIDASGLTAEGIVGNKKWSNLLSPIQPHTQALVVLDEIDKSLASHIVSSGENIAATTMNEGLSILQGTMLEITCGKNNRYTLDTSKLSFALTGAFSNTAKDVAKAASTSIGFGASQTKESAYEKPFDYDTLREHGLTEEFCGRINKIITLNNLTASTYLQMLNDTSSGPILKLQNEFNIRFHLPDSLKEEIATEAFESQLGTRYVISQLQNLIEDSIYEDADTDYVERLKDDGFIDATYLETPFD